jgi:hypothetical protein
VHVCGMYVCGMCVRKRMYVCVLVDGVAIETGAGYKAGRRMEAISTEIRNANSPQSYLTKSFIYRHTISPHHLTIHQQIIEAELLLITAIYSSILHVVPS